MTDDLDLLRHYARAGDQSAFAELVRRHLPLVYSAARLRLGQDQHLAEDISQQVFTALARHAALASIRSNLAGWLYSTTRHCAIDLLRAERRRKLREARAMSDPTAPSAELDWSRLQPVLAAVLDRLPHLDREAVLLRFFENRPFAEVGAALRLTENAARKRLDRALERMRRLLTREGIPSTSAALALLLANQPLGAASAGLTAKITTTALAATTGGATTLSSLFALMTSTQSAGILAATALALAVTAVARDGLAAYRSTNARNKEEASYRNQLAQIATKVERLGPHALSDPAPSQAQRNGQALLAANPKLKDAFLNYEAAKSVLNYRRTLALDAAGLSTPDEERVVALLDQHNPHTPESFRAYGVPYIFDVGLPAHSSNIKKADLIAAAGGQANFENFQQVTRGWPKAAQLAVATTDAAGEPLTPSQTAQIAQVFANATTHGAINWGEVTTQSASILSPTQTEALAGLRAQNDYETARRQANTHASRQ